MKASFVRPAAAVAALCAAAIGIVGCGSSPASTSGSTAPSSHNSSAASSSGSSAGSSNVPATSSGGSAY